MLLIKIIINRHKFLLMSVYILFSSPHLHISYKIGIKDNPRFESLYSTLGGIWEYSFLIIIPSLSNSFNWLFNILSLICHTHPFNWPYRNISYSTNQNIIITFHFPHIIKSVYPKGIDVISNNLIGTSKVISMSLPYLIIFSYFKLL